tara:strand:- start:2 stop:1213 length:1212 start_codon:yes stop_codon:yes gene_type:complete
MKRFRTYLKEAKTHNVSATAMESHIVVAYNGGFDKAPDTLGITREQYESAKNVSESIAKDIRKRTKAPSGSMIHFGSGNGKMVEWWKGNATPKTDLFSTAGINISLKKAGGSQLMSGLLGETKSTFRAATEYMDAHAPEDVDIMVSLLDNVLKRVVVQGNIKAMTDAVKSKIIPKKITAQVGAKRQEKTITVDTKRYQQELDDFIDWKNAMKSTSKAFIKYFENNAEFKKWFVYEAATGETKFRPDKFADSNWVVEFDPDTGKNNLIEQLSVGRAKPSPFITKLSKKANIRISAKSGSGSKMSATTFTGTTSGAFRVDIKETLYDYIGESFETFSDQLLLTEETLTEIKIIASVKKWLSNLAKGLLAKLKEVASKGLQNLLAFVGFQPDKITTSGLQLFGYNK